MPIEIKAKKKVERDEEGNVVEEDKPFHVRMAKYSECPYCGYEELADVVEDGKLLGVYYCPNCGRSFT